MATSVIRPIVAVYVNGAQKRVISGGVTHGLRSGFAAASVEFAVGDVAVPGDEVRIDLGYDIHGTRTVFTGEVSDDSLQYWPNSAAITCEGYLARMQRGLGVESVTADRDPTSGEAPAYQAEGVTDKGIIEALLVLYGVPEGDIQGDDPEQTFGNIEPVKLGKDEPGWNLSSELDRLTFCRLLDGMDGFARRVVVNGLPGSASITLTEGTSILEGGRTRSRRGIINAVTMTGLPDAGGPGVTPKAERKAPSPYIPTPPGYQSEGTSAALLETEAQCDLWAARRLAQTNRLVESVTVRPERGRPDIYPGMTLAINASHLGYSSGYVFWVEQVQHNWDARGITTTLQLLASSGESGLNPNLPPVAIIHIRMERETLADGSTIYVVFADGRDSYDPDGIAIDLDPRHGITTYLWSGSTAPVTPVGLPTATFVYPAPPTGQTITLTVADTSLKLGTATVTISAAMVAKVNVRTLWAAVESDLLFSFNGGKAWESVGFPAIGVCEQAHPEYQLAWNAAGVVGKITVLTSGTWELETQAQLTGVTAMSINIGVDGEGTGRCWAGTASGQVYRSIVDGEDGSWELVGTIAVPVGASAAITSIEESPQGNGDVYATAGNGQYHSFDSGATWTLLRAYADVALVAARQASGAYTDLSEVKNYHWVVYRGTSANTMSRFLESGSQEDLDAEVAQKPFNATGLTLGIGGPQLYASGYKDTTGYILGIEDFTGGGNLQVLAYDQDFGLPQHIVRDGDFDSIIYGAAITALFKTYDRFATILNLRNLTGAEVGHMIGYGPLHPVPPVAGALIWFGTNAPPDGDSHGVSDGGVFALTADGFERRADSPLSGQIEAQIVVATSDGVLLCYSRQDNGGVFHPFEPGSYTEPNFYRSTDGGFTWDVITMPPVNLVRVSGATVYASTRDDPSGSGVGTLWRSDDSGATWTQVQDFGTLPVCALFTCSSDPNLVVLIRPGYLDVDDNNIYQKSTDGGVNFVDTPIIQLSAANQGGGGFGHITPDGLWLLHQDTTGAEQDVWRSSLTGGALRVSVVPPQFISYTFMDDGEDIYGYGGAWPVIVSSDQGATWTDYYDDDRKPVGGFNGAAGGAMAFVPRDLTNDGYVLPHKGGGGVALALARQTVDADPLDRWDSLQSQLEDAFPDDDFYVYWDSAVRLVDTEG